MKTQVKRPDGEVVELYYYELEEFCKEQVRFYIHDTRLSFAQSLEREKKFLEFAKQYQTFSPYFDFVFTKMSYTLFQPYFIRNSVLFYHPVEKCYYVEYLGEENELDIYDRYVFRNPFLPLSREEDIWRGKIVDITDIPECFISEELELLTTSSVDKRHNAWAKLWLHNLLISRKDVCQYLLMRSEHDDGVIYTDQGSLLLHYYPWIRFGKIGHPSFGDCYVAIYHSKKINHKQAKLLRELKRKGLLNPAMCEDIR